MKYNDLTVRIGGTAGDGSLATGELLAKSFERMGFYVATDKDFPSRIRGGHTSYAIRGSEKEIFSIGDGIDALLTFDKESITLHLDEIESGGVLIYDNSKEDLEIERTDISIYKMPLANIAKKELGLELIKNTMALGVLQHLFNLDENVIKESITDTYKRKGDKMVQDNLKAFEIGKSQANSDLKNMENYSISKVEFNRDKLLMMGNEAIGLAALAAGCRFISAYPITPASDVLEFLARYMPAVGGVAIQAEVEIAAITLALGAGYAGVRAMTVTSGPGLDLKTEAMGLASMLEVPLVMVDAQRAGPSTGMPTKTEQSDINHVIYSGHGEGSRIVVVPGNVEEAFYFTFNAFNLAEKYQVPVIVLTDELISWNKQVVKRFEVENLKIDRGKLMMHIASESREFKRYEFTDDNISPRPVPGVKNGIHLETGDEHDEYGHITENVEIRKRMMNKRMKKLENIEPDLFSAEVYGDLSSDMVVIGMGSTHGPILEALERLDKMGIRVKYIRVRTLLPFLGKELKDMIKDSKLVFVVENNYTGQLANLIKLHTGYSNIVNILKYDGRAFKPVNIYSKIQEVLKNGGY